MGKIHSLDEIEKKREEEGREKFKKNIVRDIDDVFRGIFRTEPPPKKRKFSFWKVLLFIFLFILIGTIILSWIWLLKFLIKDFFFP